MPGQHSWMGSSNLHDLKKCFPGYHLPKRNLKHMMLSHAHAVCLDIADGWMSLRVCRMSSICMGSLSLPASLGNWTERTQKQNKCQGLLFVFSTDPSVPHWEWLVGVLGSIKHTRRSLKFNKVYLEGTFRQHFEGLLKDKSNLTTQVGARGLLLVPPHDLCMTRLSETICITPYNG
jgi:hypothetical protein